MPPRSPSADSQAKTPHQARPPSTFAKKGLWTVVAPHRGRWRVVAASVDRAMAVTKMRSTPSARLYSPTRHAADLTAEEAAAPVYAASAPSPSEIRAAEKAEAPARPRLTDGLNVRMTSAMRAQVEEAAADGSRWPGGYKVEGAAVVRAALEAYFSPAPRGARSGR